MPADELFLVSPRVIMGSKKVRLLLEAKSTPAFIIKPRLILVVHTDDIGWHLTSNLQEQIFVQDLNKIVSKPNVMAG